MATRWYYKVNESTIGPLSSNEMKAHIERGRVGPDTKVSTDAVRWVAAKAVNGLLLPGRSPVQRNTPERESRASEQTRRTRRQYVIAGAGALLLVGAAVWIGAVGSKAGPSGDAPAHFPNAAGTKPLRREETQPTGKDLAVQVDHLTAENAMLRAEIQRLRQHSAAHPEPGALPPASNAQLFQNPERLLYAYFQAERWQERIPLVHNSEALIQKMDEYYTGAPLRRPGYVNISPIESARSKVGDSITAVANLDGTQYPYVIVLTHDGWRIEWEASISAAENADKARLGLDGQIELRMSKPSISLSRHPFVEARLKNGTGAELSAVRIAVWLYDEAGALLDNGSLYFTDVPPGQSASAKVHFLEVTANDERDVVRASCTSRLERMAVRTMEGKNFNVPSRWVDYRHVKEGS